MKSALIVRIEPEFLAPHIVRVVHVECAVAWLQDPLQLADGVLIWVQVVMIHGVLAHGSSVFLVTDFVNWLIRVVLRSR